MTEWDELLTDVQRSQFGLRKQESEANALFRAQISRLAKAVAEAQHPIPIFDPAKINGPDK